jgi:hypothetical protein
VASSGQTAAGSPAFVSYDTGTDAAAFDGLVVLNNNGGSGGYTIYRDNVAPTGSIKIDKGAGSTTSPSLSLSLNAHNATASDPVAEMAFSVDGGAFTPFTKFAQSFNLNVSGTEGPKTVAVEYRNMAGAVSAPVTATIYLVNNPPTVTSLSPTGGSTAGGNTVTINGSHFAPRPTVKFGSTPASAVGFVSQSQLTAKAPAHALGRIDVTVTTAAGTSTATSGDRYAYGAPTVTSLSPNGGPAAGQGPGPCGGDGWCQRDHSRRNQPHQQRGSIRLRSARGHFAEPA